MRASAIHECSVPRGFIGIQAGNPCVHTPSVDVLLFVCFWQDKKDAKAEDAEEQAQLQGAGEGDW